MGTLFNYEGNASVDLEFEVEAQDAEGNYLGCDVECDRYRQITVRLDPRYKINDTETSALKDVKVNVYNSDGNPVPFFIFRDEDNSKMTITLQENKEALDQLKADLRKEIVQEITSKLFD